MSQHDVTSQQRIARGCGEGDSAPTSISVQSCSRITEPRTPRSIHSGDRQADSSQQLVERAVILLLEKNRRDCGKALVTRGLPSTYAHRHAGAHVAVKRSRM